MKLTQVATRLVAGLTIVVLLGVVVAIAPIFVDLLQGHGVAVFRRGDALDIQLMTEGEHYWVTDVSYTLESVSGVLYVAKGEDAGNYYIHRVQLEAFTRADGSGAHFIPKTDRPKSLTLTGRAQWDGSRFKGRVSLEPFPKWLERLFSPIGRIIGYSLIIRQGRQVASDTHPHTLLSSLMAS